MDKVEAKAKALPADVAANYDTAPGHGVGEYYFQGNVVHLDTVSVEDADKLVKAGFPYLVAKAADTAAKTAVKKATAPAGDAPAV